MPMIRFVNPKDPKNVVGASSSAVVTFPNGEVVYGPDAERPARPRKNESVAKKGDLHPDDKLSRPRKRVAKKAAKKKAGGDEG